MVDRPAWTVLEGPGPLVALAVHSGHDMRDETARLSALPEEARRREEDPFTETWAEQVPTRIVVHRSRFEVDMNRSRDKAVYLTPADAWGLNVWATPPQNALLDRSLALYDAFYQKLRRVLYTKVARYGGVVVLDLHTYNHRREGPESRPADPALNPEVIVGTSNMETALWGPLVDRFISTLRSYDFLGRGLDVRTDVKFKGGHVVRWIHEQFPGCACALAIEFKKLFMDEWTGELWVRQHNAVADALIATISGLIDELGKQGFET